MAIPKEDVANAGSTQPSKDYGTRVERRPDGSEVAYGRAVPWWTRGRGKHIPDLISKDEFNSRFPRSL